METITIPHIGRYPVYATLFKDVQNAAFLRDQLLQGNADFEYAFLDASMILSREHVLAACFRSINDMAHGRLRTRNVHSEIVFALSPNNNIAESFKRFGISPATSSIIAVKVATSPDITSDRVQEHLFEHVQGHAVAVSDGALLESRDLTKLRKVYKLPLPSKNATELTTEESARLSSFVLGVMALKGS